MPLKFVHKVLHTENPKTVRVVTHLNHVIDSPTKIIKGLPKKEQERIIAGLKQGNEAQFALEFLSVNS
jgi:hypothetical protein